MKQLEAAIDDLRGDCDQMSKKVTHLTAGKGIKIKIDKNEDTEIEGNVIKIL